MSCGLGAIVLVFILVKPEVAITDTPEESQVQKDIEKARQEQNSLKESIARLENNTTDEESRKESIKNKITRLKTIVAENRNLMDQHESRVAEIRKSITDRPIKQSSDVISDENVGEEQYLLGLKVEGARIAFLVDSSASMTDEKLLDIIRRKAGSSKDRGNGPKWKRTKRIVRWLLSRAPRNAEVSVIHFNESAEFLAGTGWKKASHKGQMDSILKELEVISPSGSTNLYNGLQKVKSLAPGVTDLYVITDGLPTAGPSKYGSLNPFSGCFSLLGRSSKISGECREKLFRQTVLDIYKGFSKVNVVMLPLEGDPGATPLYWQWAASTGGLLISPAEGWP